MEGHFTGNDVAVIREVVLDHPDNICSQASDEEQQELTNLVDSMRNVSKRVEETVIEAFGDLEGTFIH